MTSPAIVIEQILEDEQILRQLDRDLEDLIRLGLLDPRRDSGDKLRFHIADREEFDAV